MSSPGVPLPSRAITLMFMLLLVLVALSPCVHAGEVVSPQAVESAASAPVRIPGDIPLRRDTASDGANAVSTVWPITMGLLGLAALVVWAVRRKRLSGSSATAALGSPRSHPMWPAPLGRWLSGDTAVPVQVLFNQRLTPRHSVHLIQWQGRNYLLGCSEQHITVIDSAPVGQGTAPEAEPPKP